MHSIEHKVSSIGTLALHFSKLVPINTTWNVKVTYKHCVVKSIMPTLNSISLNTVTMFITDTFSFNSCSRTNLSMKGSWCLHKPICTATESIWTRHSWHCIHWLWRITRSRMLALLYMPMMQTFWSKDSQNPVPPVCTGALCWAWVLQVVGTDWLHHYCSTVQLYTPNWHISQYTQPMSIFERILPFVS